MLSYFLINWIPLIVRQTGQSTENAVLAVVMTNMGAIARCIVLGRLADRFGRSLIIGSGYALGAIAIALMGRAGRSSSLLFFYGFVGGFLTVGAQMCAVALCAGFYETRLRATGVGWTMGVGRIGAIVGPVLGGLLIAAGMLLRPSSLSPG
jgi:MFS transporter, AAHS family, 4-hydroxybenzoate transporter